MQSVVIWQFKFIGTFSINYAAYVVLKLRYLHETEQYADRYRGLFIVEGISCGDETSPLCGISGILVEDEEVFNLIVTDEVV